MVKETTKADAAADAGAEVAAEIPLLLREFCTRLSASDRRVELIGAFHSEENAAGRQVDVESGYKARFAEFINRPA